MIQAAAATLDQEACSALATEGSNIAHRHYGELESRSNIFTLSFISPILEQNFKDYVTLKTHIRSRWASLAFAIIILIMGSMPDRSFMRQVPAGQLW